MTILSFSNLPEKIQNKIMQEPNSGCWLWTGSWTQNGYGTYSHKLIHRVVYEILNEKIPLGLNIDHLCRVRSCVNPNHLEPVTNRVNVLRGIGFAAKNAKKTQCKYGHTYNQENTYIYTRKDGRKMRDCKICDSFYKKQRKVQP